MRAAYFENFGASDVIKNGTVEVPEVREGEMLVKIKAAGVNPVDAVIRDGHYKEMIPHTFPVILRWEMAGIVEARGHASRRFGIGEEVYAYVRRPEIQWGTFAEYIVIPECYLAVKPKKLNWHEAAGVPLAGLTAYQALYETGNLKDNQRVLILGASGGVGSFAIQLATTRNAEVVGVASKGNHNNMKELGANHTIDYKDHHIGKSVKEIFPEGVDLILGLCCWRKPPT